MTKRDDSSLAYSWTFYSIFSSTLGSSQLICFMGDDTMPLICFWSVSGAIATSCLYLVTDPMTPLFPYAWYLDARSALLFWVYLCLWHIVPFLIAESWIHCRRLEFLMFPFIAWLLDAYVRCYQLLFIGIYACIMLIFFWYAFGPIASTILSYEWNANLLLIPIAICYYSQPPPQLWLLKIGTL